MVHAYWRIGQQIVEHEQAGKSRAEYGKAVLEGLSRKLTTQFGKGFDPSSLRYMRLFYLRFTIRDAVRHKSSDEFIRSQTPVWERIVCETLFRIRGYSEKQIPDHRKRGDILCDFHNSRVDTRFYNLQVF